MFCIRTPNYKGKAYLRSSVDEAVGVERDLADHGVVRHHHGHRPEQHLQIVRQFRPARVPGGHAISFSADVSPNQW